MEEALDRATWITPHQGRSSSMSVRRCRLEVVAGPDVGAVVELAQPTIVIGRAGGSADIALNDPKVSGLHCELRLEAGGYRLRDLSSTNGTFVRGVRVVEAWLAPGSTIAVGKSAVLFTPLADAVDLPLYNGAGLAGLVGTSAPMRHLFEMIERFSRSDVTVLVQGETGTGKELVADAIHQRSPRAGGPFQVLDCSSLPEQLVEDQLFGHEPGAFTGAARATVGVFEAAHGGTLFLDEIGELPLETQAKLLRAVESRRIRRIGSTKQIACDVRIVAATNRDLAVEVNRGTFRPDLYYRLAVARLTVPPLRDRRDDIPVLVEHFIRQLDGAGVAPLPHDFLDRAQAHAWPGNVRELRNAVERAALLPHHPTVLAAESAPRPSGSPSQPTIDVTVPFKVAKQKMIDDFDRRYLEALLAANDGNISAAARAAGIDRMSIYKMIKRLGLDDRNEETTNPT